MSKGSIRLSIQKIAIAKGIENAAQLAARTGLSLNTAYPIWSETATRIDLATLSKLVETLDCKLPDILFYERNSKPRATKTRQTNSLQKERLKETKPQRLRHNRTSKKR